MTLTKNETKVLRNIRSPNEYPLDPNMVYGDAIDRLAAIEYIYYDMTDLKLTAAGAEYEKRSRRYLDGES